MRKILVLVTSLLLAASASAQEKPQSAKSTVDSTLETKIRKVWEDFKNKDKASLSSALAADFREVEEGATGFGDKKAELASVDEFEITTYTLKDFTVRSLGPNSALVTYLAHYEGKAGNEAVNTNSAFGEVWIRDGNTWKGLYVQETALK
jgi:phosphate-selective porin